MEVEFLGAAQTVTGSKHVVRTADATVLLDCGLFQGRRAEANDRNRNLGLDPGELDAVVLSHAHIDHSGALPLLVKQGYDGPIFATPATRDPKNMVVIVGFQAQHTLGRRLVERRAQVRIFGVFRELRAEVVVLNGFSAHADQKDLTAFASQVALRGALEAIVLVHGEPSAQAALRARLSDIAVPVHIPAQRARLTL